MKRIDFVIMWVDGSDKKWQKEKEKYACDIFGDCGNNRYRDWGNLKYLFRGIEEYAPWVNHIYLVTCGHIPEWLDKNNPKISVVKHSDFMPSEYLPTFSSHSIELNLHRIEGLSENFVLLNDDTFIFNKTTPNDFFKNDIPRDSACLYINIPTGELVDSVFMNDIRVINKYFSYRKALFKNPLKWINVKNGKYLYNNLALAIYDRFAGIHFLHFTQSFCKKSFLDVWNYEYDLLDNTCKNKFRNVSDVNQWLIKYWQICNGDFAPRSVKWGKYYEYSMGYDLLKKIFKSKKYKVVCLNDNVSDDDFETAKIITNELFQKKLPNKSSFEK